MAIPHETHNKDGRHIDYIERADRWRCFDPDLFDILRHVVATDQRHIGALEAANILSGAVFASDVIPTGGLIAQRRNARRQWFQTVRLRLEEADLVFVDPDNGLEPGGYKPGLAKSGKSVLLSELGELAMPGRCLVVYHHQTRRRGGHQGEIEYWAGRLRASGFTTVDGTESETVFASCILSVGRSKRCSSTGRGYRGSLEGIDLVASRRAVAQ